MSREAWNTGTGKAGEDMPRKSLDIRFTDYPLVRERSPQLLSPLPARMGPGSARAKGQGDYPLAGS